jgi:hypothetical protein
MAETNCHETSILERLRRKLVAVEYTTEEEALQKMNLIIENRSKFPTRLRRKIVLHAMHSRAQTKPQIFLQAVCSAVKAFSFRRLDQDVDTEDEAEIAIRFFPSVLTEISPILNLLSSTKSISFVPLFMKLGLELVRDEWPDFHYKSMRLRYSWPLVMRLLCNNSYRGVDMELNQKSLLTLMRLKQKGLLKKEDIHSSHVTCLIGNDRRESAFIETRLRLLFEWNPTLLQEFGRSSNYWYPNFSNRIFELVFELGTSHFPGQVGFVFHNANYSNFCNWFGTKRVTDVIHKRILQILARSNTELRAAVLNAATTDEISLDGLYTLLRCDPAVLITKSSTKLQKRKRSVSPLHQRKKACSQY